MSKLTEHQQRFIQSVLGLKPRIAAFDCDGTLWSGDAGEGFFSWELEQGLVSSEVVNWAKPRYADYRAGKVAEEIMCGEMVTMHRGLPEDIVEQAAKRYFEQHFTARIFPEMQELITRLRSSGCEVWAVSSTNLWVIAAAMEHFGIAAPKILAASVKVHDGIISDQLIRVPSGPDKPKALREVLTGPLDCAFGNSKWDQAMLTMAKFGFAINPNPDLRETALKSGWVVYQPDPRKQLTGV